MLQFGEKLLFRKNFYMILGNGKKNVKEKE